MNIALVLSGGIGNRLHTEIPKQYIRVQDKMILLYCVETLINNKETDAVQIVADEIWHKRILEEAARLEIKMDKFLGFTKPGETRQLSIFSGLQDISRYVKRDAAVMIHDAARPLLSEKQINECYTALAGHDGVMPVLPMKDTVYKSNDGISVSGLLDRRYIYAGQSPEVFQFQKYYVANKKLLPRHIFEINGSTEVAIRSGMDIVMIPGDENNFKITTIEDLRRFQRTITN